MDTPQTTSQAGTPLQEPNTAISCAKVDDGPCKPLPPSAFRLTSVRLDRIGSPTTLVKCTERACRNVCLIHSNDHDVRVVYATKNSRSLRERGVLPTCNSTAQLEIDAPPDPGGVGNQGRCAESATGHLLASNSGGKDKDAMMDGTEVQL